MSELPHVEIFTDGACSGNPGPGGWGAILKSGGRERELNGREDYTTNNQMELMAAISALEALKKRSFVDLTTDSQYVRQGITGWIFGWKRNGWLTADKKPVKNAELWKRLDLVANRHEVNWHWIKGHAGHTENERADQLARDAIAGRIVSEDAGSDERNYVNRLVSSVRVSIKNRNWDSALFVALLLPGICAQIEAPDEHLRRRYVRWWDVHLQSNKNIKSLLSRLEGRDAYALRCSMLHELDDDFVTRQRAQELLESVHFVTPHEGNELDRKRETTVVPLRIDILCEEICSATERWFSDVKDDPEIKMRMNSFLVIGAR